MDKDMDHGGFDHTGVGAAACARHGAFAPCSVVNFQKGERWASGLPYSSASLGPHFKANEHGLFSVPSTTVHKCQ